MKALLLQVHQQSGSVLQYSEKKKKGKDEGQKKDQHSSVGQASEVDIFLNLRGETVTSIITEKTATAKKTQAASDYPGREKRLTNVKL